MTRTRIAKIDPNSPDDGLIREAVKLMMQGFPIAFPTETVYGLGVCARSPKGIEAIYAIKGRSQGKPLQLMISDLDMLKLVIKTIPDKATPLMEKYWPGPLTIIFKTNTTFAAAQQRATVAIRYPNHPIPLSIIRRLENPLAATSANLSGRLSPRRAVEVFEQLDGKIPLILDGGSCTVGQESTLVDMTLEKPKIVRQGALSAEELSPYLS